MKYWQNKKIAEGGQLNNSWYAKMYTDYFDLEPSFYSGKKVLDIGCGPRGSLEWAKMAAERVGLDPLADDYRQLNADQHEMTYVAAKAESIPFEDDYFDVVTAFNSLEFVDDLKAAISEIKRVLKPGGIFLLLSEIQPNSNTDQLVAASWKITQAFLPDFQLITEKHYEKTANSLTQSIQQRKIYNHQDLSNRLGILVAMFSQGKSSLNTLYKDSEIQSTQSILSSPTLTSSKDQANHFVILATKRTGSNLLVRLLNQSPPIICYGEIMKTKYSKEKGADKTFHQISQKTNISVDKLYSLQSKNPVEFLKIIFDIHRDRTVGFKLFYEHKNENNRNKVWDFLLENKHLKIVHLIRKNLLDVLTSLEYAKLTQKWVDSSLRSREKERDTSKISDQDSIVLPVKKCQSFFEDTQRNIDQNRQLFSHHSYLEVYYEDLVADYNKETARVFDFLKVPTPLKLKILTQKQSQRSNPERIKNYQEILNYFEKSKWSYFFENLQYSNLDHEKNFYSPSNPTYYGTQLYHEKKIEKYDSIENWQNHDELGNDFARQGNLEQSLYSYGKAIEMAKRNSANSFKVYCNLAEALELLQKTKYQTDNKSIEYDVVIFNPYLKGGLCNRLRVLTSCMVLSQFWNIPLLMCWSSGPQCDSDFEQLYEPICQTIDQEEVWTIIRQNPLKTLYITNPLKISDWYYQKYLSQVMTQAEFKQQYFKQLRNLKLQSNLQEKIEQYINKNFQHDIVGLHIRQTDMLNLYERYSLDPSRISDEKFFHKIEQEISQGTSKLFLATDNAETQKIFKDKFPNQIISYCEIFEESRKRQTDVEDAIIDLYLLANTQKIIGSYISSFSKLASHLGGISLEYP